MISRDMKRINVLAFNEGKDEYGRVHKTGNTVRTAEMSIKIYKQSNVNDIRYVDTTHIGLTADKNINIHNQIEYDGNKYQVLYVIPSHRLNQIFMKKV